MTKFKEMKHYFNEYGMKLKVENMDDIYDYVAYYTSSEVMEEMDDECFVKEYLKDGIFCDLNEDNFRTIYNYSKILCNLFGDSY